MKKLSFTKSLAVFGLAAVCAVGATGCSGSSESGDAPTYTGGVAATVNGTEIQEDTVTAAIENIRASMGLTDEQAWGEWLAENDYTPESVRQEIIDGYVDEELVKQGSETLDIHADEAEVDQYVESMRNNYDSDETWQSALASVGMTEDEYRQNIALTLETQLLKAKVAEGAAEPTDEELLTMAQNYLSSFDGAKKSSHILFDASDEATAKEVLEKIKSGDLDFATAAAEYSKDTGTSGDGGNVGWDALNNLVTEYTTALDELNKDDVSELVTSSYGIHIIKCTDVYNAPETLEKFSDLPEEFQESVRAMYATQNESQAYYSWLEEQREAADIQVNDMPEGLPYYVDMANFPKEESDADATGITAVDEDGNPIDIEAVEAEGDGASDEGSDDAEAPVAEGVEAGAEGAEGEADAAAQQVENDAAADAAEQPVAEGDAGDQGSADGEDAAQQPAEGAAE